MPSRVSPRPIAAPSPKQGVYRFREKVDGCAAWYSVDAAGNMADFRVVRPGTSEAATVAELAIVAFGAAIERPMLRVVTGAPSGASLQPGVFVRLLPAPRAPRS
jgi:hypothetical protein